uniref:type II toxin-antitoxin system RelE/ParE family toxin n=1 Tax=Gelidibacter sp. TaxID=2018083 RepID=UPI004049F956
MRVKILKSFSIKLQLQVQYISKDKPQAARQFKNDIILQLKELEIMPFKHKKSIYFEDENIRDLVFKGYTIVYRIKPEEQIVKVFGFIKYREKL